MDSDLLDAFNRLDNEEKVMVLGAAVCISVLLSYVLRCLGSCFGAPSELEALRQATPVLSVRLQKGNEKLGLCLRAEGGYATITGISEGDLLDLWNRRQPHVAQRLRVGDRILAVRNGEEVCRDGRVMALKLKEAEDVTLTIGITRTSEEIDQCWQRMVGMVTLPDVILAEAAEFGPPEASSAGAALDKVALEVLKVKPQLQAWNQQCQWKGTCSTQQLEVGDRVISIAGSTKVRRGLRQPSPTVTLVRWKLMAKRHVFDAVIQRASPEDRMGMVICPHPLAHGPAMVLKIVGDGAVSRWNSSDSAMGGTCQIHPGDSIVSVNGASSYAAMQKELASTKLVLRLERWRDELSSAPAAPVAPLAAPLARAAPVAAMAASTASPERGSRGPIFWLFLGALLLLVPSFLPDEQLAVLANVCNLPKQLPPSSQGTLALPLLGFAWLLLMRFIWCEVSAVKKTVLPQPVLAFLSSTCFGYGTFFLCNWAGVHS